MRYCSRKMGLPQVVTRFQPHGSRHCSKALTIEMNVAAYSTMVKSEQTSTLETDIHSDKRRSLVAIGWVTAMEAMQKFVHEQNVAHYRQHLAGNGLDDETDEATRKTLLHLLAEEETKLAVALKSKKIA
jgi:hypothetical protein